MSTLVLNADALPTNYLPLSVVDWQEAIRYMVSDRAKVLTFYDDWVVSSPSWETHVPAVIMLSEYQKPKKTVRLNKRNVYLRDNFHCQYCSKAVDSKTASIDHVLPLSKGGKNRWNNLTTACKNCNSYKSSKLIKPKNQPYKPEYYELVSKRKQRGYTILHPSWREFLF